MPVLEWWPPGLLEVADLKNVAEKPDPAELVVGAVGDESTETEEAEARPDEALSLRRKRRCQ